MGNSSGSAGLACSPATTMVSHAGPSKPVLVLLVCAGTWLSICTPSFGAPQPSAVKEELGVPELLDRPYPPLLPCFTLHPEASNNISVLQAHLESVKMLSHNKTTIDALIKRLGDLKSHNVPKPNISEPPQDSFKRKCFIMTVLGQLSTCVTNTYEAFLKRLEVESLHKVLP